jgi:DNA-binding response OmpR family regulator
MLTIEPKDVLLAEDDHDDVEFFQSAIRDTTIPVELRHAKDGEELFLELKRAVPNLLFLDIQMPCKDGISCILEIRKNRKYDRLPVVMFSSLSHKSYVDKTYRYGANYYVVKPTSVAALTQRLQYLLSVEWEKQLYYPPKEEFLLS